MARWNSFRRKRAVSKDQNEYLRDVFDEFLSGTTVAPKAPFTHPRKTLYFHAVIAAFKFMSGLLQRTRFKGRVGSGQVKSGHVWAYSTTINQHQAISSVLEEISLPKIDLFGLHPSQIWGKSIYGSAIFLLPTAIRLMTKLPKPQFKTIANQIELLALILAECREMRRRIRRNHPSALIVTNDHSPRNRGIMRAARIADIPVVYIQHAAVGGVERPLDNMTMALLHGQHSLDIYKALGTITADIHLIGSPKVDAAVSSLKTNLSRHECAEDSHPKICIFPGLFDEIERVAALVLQISIARPHIEIWAKLHPRDIRLTDWQSRIGNATKIIDAPEALATTILSECRVAIFDDSNIGLEACAMHIPVIKYLMKSEASDQYNLLDSGFYEACTANENTLIPLLDRALRFELKMDEKLIKYFFDNFNTDTFGKSHKVAAQLIEDMVSQNDIRND